MMMRAEKKAKPTKPNQTNQIIARVWRVLSDRSKAHDSHPNHVELPVSGPLVVYRFENSIITLNGLEYVRTDVFNADLDHFR